MSRDNWNDTRNQWNATTDIKYDQVILTWKIRNFETYLTSSGCTEPIESDMCYSPLKPAIKWKLLISGKTLLFGNYHTKIDLEIQNEQLEKVVTDVVIAFINDSNEEAHRQTNGHIFTGKNERKRLYDIPCQEVLDSTNECLPNGTLTIRCIINYLLDIDHSQSLMPNIEFPEEDLSFVDLLDNDFLSDFAIVTKDRKFAVHKMVLAARSPVLCAMFQHQFSENQSNQMEVIDDDTPVVHELLRYIYTGKVEDIQKYSLQLLTAADKYQIDGLKSQCEKYLSTTVTSDNSQELLQLSQLHSAHRLEQFIHRFVQLHRFNNGT